MASAKSAVVVRPIQPADHPAVVSVLEASFDRWPQFEVSHGPIAFLDWFLEPTPTDEWLNLLVEVDGNVAGVGLSVSRPVYVGRQERDGALGAYSAVHPEQQGRGLYSSINAKTYRPGLTWSYSRVARIRNTSSEVSELSLDSGVNVWLRVLDPMHAAKHSGRRARLLVSAGYASQKLLGWTRARTAPEVVGLRIVENKQFEDGQVRRLWEDARAGFDIIPERSADYLNWRYHDARGGRFTTLSAFEGEDLVGYVACSERESRGHIVDILVSRGRDDVLHSLLSRAVAVLSEQGSDSVELLLAGGHPYDKVLRRARFVRLGGRSQDASGAVYLRPSRELERELASLGKPGIRGHLVEADFDLI